MAYRLLHKKSSVLGKKPTKDQLEYGELAINYAVSGETISIRNSNDEIVSFINEKEVDLKIANLVSGAPETLDTIYELASAFTENKDVVEILQQSITNKQETLVSGLNIKTLNNESLLGEGNIVLNFNNYYTKDEINTIKNTITDSLNEVSTTLETQDLKLQENEKVAAIALIKLDNNIKQVHQIINENANITTTKLNELQIEINDFKEQINQHTALINQLRTDFENLKKFIINNVTDTTLNVNGIINENTLEIPDAIVDIEDNILIL